MAMANEQQIVRHYEYRDANGKKWGATQHLPGGNRAKANELLAHTAHVNGWTDLEVFPQNMPLHEQKRRINAIQQENGNPPLYDEHETREPSQKPAPNIIILKDHANAEQGRPIEEVHAQPGIRATSAAVPMTGGIITEGVAGVPVPRVPIIDHANDAAAAAVSASADPAHSITNKPMIAPSILPPPSRPLPGQG